MEIRDTFQCILCWDQKGQKSAHPGPCQAAFGTSSLPLIWIPTNSWHRFALAVGIGRPMGRGPCLFPLKAGPIPLSCQVRQSCHHSFQGSREPPSAFPSLPVVPSSSQFLGLVPLRNKYSSTGAQLRTAGVTCVQSPVSAFSSPMAEYAKPTSGEDGFLSVTPQLKPFLQCPLLNLG